MPVRTYWIYILASHSRRLYVGMTNDLARRVAEHRLGRSAFTRRYRITRLVHYEMTPDVWAAIGREQEIKGWTREKKLLLIESNNAGWVDLAPCHSERSEESGRLRPGRAG